jgi:hypothetical protein
MKKTCKTCYFFEYENSDDECLCNYYTGITKGDSDCCKHYEISETCNQSFRDVKTVKEIIYLSVNQLLNHDRIN